MAQITKQLATRIVKKLSANVISRPRSPHDWAQIEHEGQVVAGFGIRRGSRKDLGHDHIPSQLYVSPRQAKLLGQCPMTKQQWLTVMREKGLL